MEIGTNFSEKAQKDYQLVQRAIKGDQKAYAELMDRYKDAIYYMLLRMVNNPIDAEDLTIEAFGKAFKNLHQYTPNFAFSTWLFKIATNNCIDFIRKRKANLISIDQPDEETDKTPSQNLEAEVPDPEESLINSQKERLLKELINKLKPRYRRLIELRYFEELSYEEIAEELELPLGTVKAQLFRARELLFNILKHTKTNL